MRRLILLITFFATIQNSSGQEINVEKATAKDLLVPAYSLHSVKEFSGRQIAIKVIEVQLIIKHPEDESQEVVVSNFLITVRELIEDKDSNADFWVKGQFFNPRDFKFDPADKVISFKHGTEKNSKTTNLIVSTKGINVK